MTRYYTGSGAGASEMTWAINWEWNTGNVKRDEFENPIFKRQACSRPTGTATGDATSSATSSTGDDLSTGDADASSTIDPSPTETSAPAVQTCLFDSDCEDNDSPDGNCLASGVRYKPRAAQDHHEQIIAGITAESLAGTRVVNANANGAMSSHFRSSVSKKSAPEAPKSITAFKESLLELLGKVSTALEIPRRDEHQCPQYDRTCRFCDMPRRRTAKKTSERCNQFFLGEPPNRWSDMTLQFVVCEIGVSALIGEHSMLDGMSVRQLNRSITLAIQAHEARYETKDPLPSTHDRLQELFFKTDSEIETQITLIRDTFRNKYSPIEFVHDEINILGAALLRAHKCPSKAGYQIIIQLACLVYYGYQPDSWETVSMSRFHMGRVDWIQASQTSMADFCAAALDQNVDHTQKRQFFFGTVNNFVNTLTQISQGYGFKAHMHALLAMVTEDETLPELFRDKAWRDTTVASVKTVKTDCLEGAMLQETAFLMPEPKCIFLH
ncbi:MAG: hypothetical protein Q9192_005192 [Flavoplaca navasiana]